MLGDFQAFFNGLLDLIQECAGLAALQIKLKNPRYDGFADYLPAFENVAKGFTFPDSPAIFKITADASVVFALQELATVEQKNSQGLK